LVGELVLAAAPWTTQAVVVRSAALSATIMIRRIVPPLAQRKK